MIETKKDLQYFLNADRIAMNLQDRHWIRDYLAASIAPWRIWSLVKCLRCLEYALNRYNKKHGVLRLVRYLFFKRKYFYLQMQMGMFISPNVFGPGLNVVHPGYIWAASSSRVGKNCTILPRVLLGKKHPRTPAPCIFIGDDCYIGTGSTILGPIHIGNNVTIAAGAVVVKDVPDNCIVAGNPATIIKYKTSSKNDEKIV